MADVSAVAPQEFLARKRQILASLDRSPKGSLDAPIVDFLNWLNEQERVVTTSSCSGRIAIFHGSADTGNSKGGQWLLASHSTVENPGKTWEEIQEWLQSHSGQDTLGTLTTLLLEPFVLHAECADAGLAQHMLSVAREAGFRESGISLGRKRVLVQIRTLAMRLEVPLAMDGQLLVDETYFQTLIRLANQRLDENLARTNRLWMKLKEAFSRCAVAAQELWVLVCAQLHARSVKLALEGHAWLDDNRKMQRLAGGDEKGANDDSIGLPLTPEGVENLKALAETVEEEMAQREPVVEETKINDQADQAAQPAQGSKLPKRQRPPIEAANLEALWRQGSLRLTQAELPLKSRPAPASGLHSGAKERSLEQVLRNLIDELKPPLDVTLADTLLKEICEMPSVLWRGDVALLTRGALTGSSWETVALAAEALPGGGLWERFRQCLGARMLARQQEIRVDDEVRGGNVQVLAGSGSGWVVVPGPKGVRYSFDVTKCMFSEGNAGEKERVATWPVEGETVLDLYAGIGFWTLPLLAAGAQHVFACEWNPDALEGLREGLRLLGRGSCQVLAGDNRRLEVVEAVRDKCHRVILGLIPFSRDGFPVAAAALRPSGGILHVHWNAAVDAETETAEKVAMEIEQVLKETRGGDWKANVTAVQRVKNFAPRVRHLRIDISCHSGAEKNTKPSLS